MIRKIALLMSLSLVLCTGIAVQGAQKEQSAVASAEKWLAALDQGLYAESWQQAATYLKNAVTKGQFEQSMQAVRKPLGRLVSRTVQSATYKTSLPGVPDGKYVVITFESAFENKASAIETVTPTLDKDGKWRVSGYFIR